MFTIREAAKRLERDRTTLFRQIQSGAIKADNESGVWLITSQELERYARENKGKPGRKPKNGGKQWRITKTIAV